MKNKIILLIIMILLITPLIQASSLEVSLDNVTFRNANIVVEDNIVSVVGLECDTEYYFRVNNAEYFKQRTEDCGLNQMEIALLLFLSVLVIGGIIGSIVTSGFFRFVYLLFAGLMTLVTLNITANLSESAGLSAEIVNVLWTVYTVSLWLYVFMFFTILVLFIIYLRIRRNPMPTMGSPLQDSSYLKR